MLTLGNVLTQQFFARHTPDVARDLLGCYLWRRMPDGTVLRARIVETEAYRDNEPACHAARGPTPRCQVMFGPPGMAYVYFIYGSYHCLNVVTEPEGSGCAVLIRALEADNANGPGKLCREWGITKEHNGINLVDDTSALWISEGDIIKDSDVGISSRIGITSAKELMWRYFIKGHPNVSGPKSYNQSDEHARSRRR